MKTELTKLTLARLPDRRKHDDRSQEFPAEFVRSIRAALKREASLANRTGVPVSDGISSHGARADERSRHIRRSPRGRSQRPESPAVGEGGQVRTEAYRPHVPVLHLRRAIPGQLAATGHGLSMRLLPLVGGSPGIEA